MRSFLMAYDTPDWEYETFDGIAGSPETDDEFSLAQGTFTQVIFHNAGKFPTFEAIYQPTEFEFVLPVAQGDYNPVMLGNVFYVDKNSEYTLPPALYARLDEILAFARRSTNSIGSLFV